MKSVLFVMLLMVMSGCSVLDKVAGPVPDEVLVEVAGDCKEPPVIELPHLPIHDLVPGDNPSKVGKAYVLSIGILQKKVDEMKTILDGYRKQK